MTRCRAYIFNRLESIVAPTLVIVQPKTDSNVKQTVRGTADLPYSQLSTLIFVVDTYTAIKSEATEGRFYGRSGGRGLPIQKSGPSAPPNEVHHAGILTEVSTITSLRLEACVRCVELCPHLLAWPLHYPHPVLSFLELPLKLRIKTDLREQ